MRIIAETRHRKQAENSLGAFLERLRKFPLLDPACGSGNFLYLALHAFHDLEHRVQLEAEAVGLQRGFPSVGTANVKGIELNAYAAELARVSVWIGESNGCAATVFRVHGNPSSIRWRRSSVVTRFGPAGGRNLSRNIKVLIG